MEQRPRVDETRDGGRLWPPVSGRDDLVSYLAARALRLKSSVVRYLRRFGQAGGRCPQLFDLCAAWVESLPDYDQLFPMLAWIDGLDAVAMVEEQLEDRANTIAFACGVPDCAHSPHDVAEELVEEVMVAIDKAFHLDLLGTPALTLRPRALVEDGRTRYEWPSLDDVQDRWQITLVP